MSRRPQGPVMLLHASTDIDMSEKPPYLNMVTSKHCEKKQCYRRHQPQGVPPATMLEPMWKPAIKAALLPSLSHTGVDFQTRNRKVYEYPYLYKSSIDLVSRKKAIREAVRNPYSQLIHQYCTPQAVLSPIAIKLRKLDIQRSLSQPKIARVLTSHSSLCKLKSMKEISDK